MPAPTGHPAITVLLPVYNGAKYLNPAVESLLAQTFRDFELLLINDGSTDESAAILAGYDDRRIRLEHNPTNLGLPATLNKGLELARAPYIARMDCDDISLPTRLEKQFHYLEAHPEIGILGSNYRLIGSQGSPGDFSNFPSEHCLIRWGLIFGSQIPHPCAMMRLEVLRRLGGYRPLTVAQDYDLWQRAAWETRLANLPESLLLLRYHATSSSRSRQSLLDKNSDEICQAILARMLGSPPPEEVVGPLRSWKFDAPGGFDRPLAQRAAILLEQACRAHIQDPTLDGRERRLVRTDAAKRLLHLARRGVWPAIPLALQLDALIPLRLPFFAMRRHLRHRRAAKEMQHWFDLPASPRSNRTP